MNLVYFLLIGIVAGWLAGLVLKGRGFGLIGNMIAGVAGAFAGGYLFGLAGIEWGGVLGQIGTSTIGAIAVLVVIGLLRKAA